MKVVIFCCLLAFCCCLAAAQSVPCESIVDNICRMTGLTVIDSPGVSISSTADTSIRTLYFNGNKKIKFLPLNASEKFPSLEAYDASHCSIETITKENFKGLSKLRNLYLRNNKIEKVSSDAFEGLIALEILFLENNKIKFINSAAFRGLSKLTYVDLRGNICIQGGYTNAASIATMISTLTDKCGFSENPFLLDFARKTSDQVNKISESLAGNRQEQREQTNTSNSLIRETKAEIKAEIVNFRNKNAESFASIEAELETAKTQIGELRSEGQRNQIENMKLLTQIRDLKIKFADLEKIEVRKETELKILREQNRKFNDELTVNLETMKTQIQTDFSQLQASTNKCEQETRNSAVKLAVCESELNGEKAKQANNQMLQATNLNKCEQESKKCASELSVCETKLETSTKNLSNCKHDLEKELTLKQEFKEQSQSQIHSLTNEITKERTALNTLESECKAVKDMLNETKIERKSEETAHQTTIGTMTTQSEMLRNDLKQCEIDKINFRDDFRESKAKLEVFTDIDISRLREEMRSAIDLLQNTNKV